MAQYTEATLELEELPDIDLDIVLSEMFPFTQAGEDAGQPLLQLTPLERDELNRAHTVNVTEKEGRRTQDRIEMAIIKRNGRCPASVLETAAVQLYRVDGTALSSELEVTAPAETYQDTRCLVDAISYRRDGKGLGISINQQVRDWITEIKQIGAESIEGVAMLAGPASLPDMFIIKAPRSRGDHLCHEAIIGLYALNPLRRFIPNFMFVYSAFFCSPPVLKNRQVTTWCTKEDGAVTYLVLENIKGGVPMNEFIKTCTEVEYAQVYLQLLLALNMAWNSCQYTHFDLHYGNVLVQRLPYLIAIPYQTSKGTSYLHTMVVARIIDYGFSHAVLDGAHFGAFTLSTGRGDYGFPLFDAYKQLLFVANGAIRAGRSSVVALMDSIYALFNEGMSVVQRASVRPTDEYYNLDLSSRSISMETFIDAVCAAIAPTFLLSAPLKEAMVYQGAQPRHFDAFMGSIVDLTHVPRTLHEVCYTMAAIHQSHLEPRVKSDMAEWLRSNFDPTRALNNDALYVSTVLEELEKGLAKIKSPELEQDFKGNVANSPYYVETYKKLLARKAHLHELFFKSKSWFKTTKCALLGLKRYDEFAGDLSAVGKRIAIGGEILKRHRAKEQANLAYVTTYKPALTTESTAFYRKELPALVAAL